MAKDKEFSISEKDFIKFQEKYYGVVGKAAANARYRDSLWAEVIELRKEVADLKERLVY